MNAVLEFRITRSPHGRCARQYQRAPRRCSLYSDFCSSLVHHRFGGPVAGEDAEFHTDALALCLPDKMRVSAWATRLAGEGLCRLAENDLASGAADADGVQAGTPTHEPNREVGVA
jgi:hypothetical protein